MKKLQLLLLLGFGGFFLAAMDEKAKNEKYDRCIRCLDCGGTTDITFLEQQMQDIYRASQGSITKADLIPFYQAVGSNRCCAPGQKQDRSGKPGAGYKNSRTSTSYQVKTDSHSGFNLGAFLCNFKPYYNRPLDDKTCIENAERAAFMSESLDWDGVQKGYASAGFLNKRSIKNRSF